MSQTARVNDATGRRSAGAIPQILRLLWLQWLTFGGLSVATLPLLSVLMWRGSMLMVVAGTVVAGTVVAGTVVAGTALTEAMPLGALGAKQGQVMPQAEGEVMPQAEGEAPSVRAQATVGAIGRIDELGLPGSLLRAKPLEDRDLPVVVRIVDSFPHGDAHRYQLSFMALEPGRYDLRDYLERVDGSRVDDLPEIWVEIVSVLAPGHVPPHVLDASWPRVGSYRFWALLALVAWVAGLLAFVLWPKRRSPAEAPPRPALTLAELLQPRLAAAFAGQLDNRQLAELERWVVEFWRRRLGLMDVPPRQALMELRASETAGPLLRQLERWLHSPHRDPNVSLGQLLQPYQDWLVSPESEQQLSQSLDRAPLAEVGGGR
jgi:hypothetical protein